MLHLHVCPQDGAKLTDKQIFTSLLFSDFFLLLSYSTPAWDGFYIHSLLHKQICIICNLNIPFFTKLDIEQGFDKGWVLSFCKGGLDSFFFFDTTLLKKNNSKLNL